jgi:hypothetical protein
MGDESLIEFFKNAKRGDKLQATDGAGNPVEYVMAPGTYMNVAGNEEDPFIQAYLNSIDFNGGGRKFFPQRIK